MRSPRSRRPGVLTRAPGVAVALGLAVALLAAGLVAGCEPAATVAPPAGVVEHRYSICPMSGELPAQDVTKRATDAIGARLAWLEVEESSVAVAACMDVTATTTDAAQEAAVRAAVGGTGAIELIPVDRNRIPAVVVGGPRPEGLGAIISSTDIVGSGTQDPAPGGASLTIGFSAAGTTALGNWTRANVGGALAFVVDGVVMAMPVINEPIIDGKFEMTFAAEPPIPVRAIEAMIASGPLPPEWAQPERAQG